MRRKFARFETGKRSIDSQIDRFARPFNTRRAAPVEEHSTYYDTFDWRLQRAGAELALTTRGEQSLLSLALDRGATRVVSAVEHAPTFAAELSGGELHDRLLQLTEMRRLIPVTEVRRHDRRLDILDDVDKTVARVSFVERSTRRAGGPIAGSNGAWKSLASEIRVHAIRGYEEAFADVRRFASRSMGLETSHTSDLAASFEALSLESGRDPSKLSIELDEDASAYEALQTILGALLVVIRTNEAGTLADLDSEYLHDFRVSVRRTRAVLSELGDVFSEELSAHLKTEFRWLGSVTGATRDLDVLLLKLEDYAGLLGKSLRKGVADLEDSIRARRAIERGQMVALLQSDRYGALIEGCESALRSPDHVGKAAARSVRSVACERIAQRAKRVFKRAARIGPDCPARRVHDLRLECKKLRYLLEVFHSLCEPGPFAHVVKALKRIQTGLGDFNDYHVHADWLREIEGEQASGGLVNGTALPASTPLIPCLEKAAEKARKVTAERLTRFLTTENRRRFEQVIVKDAPDA